MFTKGHKINLGKHRGGRKTKAEEIKQAIENIQQEALIKLANKIIYKRLKAIDDDKSLIGAKDFALPVSLKGITENKAINVSGNVDIKTINYIKPDNANTNANGINANNTPDS
jgi:hypothetical protein